MDTVVNVVQCLFVDIVDVNLYFFIRDVFVFEVLFHEFACLVGRSIINIHNVVILIVLHEDRVQISQIKLRFDVFVGRDKNTESELVFVVLAQLVEGFVIQLFILHYLFDGLCLLL